MTNESEGVLSCNQSSQNWILWSLLLLISLLALLNRDVMIDVSVRIINYFDFDFDGENVVCKTEFDIVVELE